MIDLNVDFHARVRECVRVSIIQSNRSRITYILLFTISHSVQSFIVHSHCLLCKNPENESPLVTKNETFHIGSCEYLHCYTHCV